VDVCGQREKKKGFTPNILWQGESEGLGRRDLQRKGHLSKKEENKVVVERALITRDKKRCIPLCGQVKGKKCF